MTRYYTPHPAIGAAFPKLKRIKRRVGKGWRGVKPGAVVDIPEAGLQALCEQYLDACGLQWVHIPASALRACAWGSATSIGQKREISDYCKGVPDLLIFGPAREGQAAVRALCVELKVGRNTMTDGQRRWAQGTRVNECRDFDTFKALVDVFTKENG